VDIASIRSADSLRFLPELAIPIVTDVEVLGYDVGWLMGRHSIVWQPGFMDRADEATRSAWAARLNGNGLLDSVTDAQEFRELFYAQPVRESGGMEILEVALWSWPWIIESVEM
jgi:hypothetical protein